MKSRSCTFKSCGAPVASGQDILRIYRRYDLPTPDALGRHSWCLQHSILAGERALRHAVNQARGDETELEKMRRRLAEIEADIKRKPASAPAPTRSYPTDPASMTARLREIEADLRKPTLAQRKDAAERERLARLERQLATRRQSPKEEWRWDEANRRYEQVEPLPPGGMAARIGYIEAVTGRPFDPTSWSF
jgi:hypothetical protein